MATTVYKSKLTVYEQAKRLDPSNGVATIAELLNEISEFMVDAVAVMANDINSNQSHVRTQLPVVGIRRINEGASSTGSVVVPQRDDIMLLEAIPKIDEKLIDNMPDPRKSLNNEIMPYMEAEMQAFIDAIFYGSPSDSLGEITGLSNKFGDLALDNVAGLGGTGSDLNSVWMIEWDPNTCRLIYPRDSKTVGIEWNDRGKETVYDSSNNPYIAYVNQIKMQFGLAVTDHRNAQRICNIETDGILNNINDIANVKYHELVKARNRLLHAGKNAVIYANRTIKSQFDIFALDKANGFYMMENITGEPLSTFQGIPIRLVEGLLSTESAVT
jgi:hypothetical protein